MKSDEVVDVPQTTELDNLLNDLEQVEEGECESCSV